MRNLIIAITLVLMSCGHASDSATKSSTNPNVKMHLTEKSALSLTDNGVQGVAFDYLRAVAYSHTAGMNYSASGGASGCSVGTNLPTTWSCVDIKNASQPILKSGGIIDILSLPDVLPWNIPVLENGFSMDFLVVIMGGPAVISDNIMYGQKTILADEWKSVQQVSVVPTWPVVNTQAVKAAVVFVRNDWIGESLTIGLKPECTPSDTTTPCVKDQNTKEIGFTSRSLSSREQERVDMFVHDIINTPEMGAGSAFYFVPVMQNVIQNNETLDIKLVMDFSDITVTPAATVAGCSTTWAQEKAKYIAQQQATFNAALATWNATDGSLPEGMRTHPAPVMPTLPAAWQTVNGGWTCPTANVTSVQQDTSVSLSSNNGLPFDIHATYTTAPAAK